MGLFDKMLGKEGGAVTLNKQEAFAAVAVAMIGADGDISQEELQRTVINLASVRLFRRYDMREPAETLNRVAGTIKKRGVPPVLDAVKVALPKEQAEAAFFVAADLVMADGVVELEEKKLLEDMQRVLQIDEATATKIVEVALIKNKA